MPVKKSFKIDWSSAMQKMKEQNEGNKNSYKDERIYYPKLKEDGTAQAIIRFLPSPDTDIPFVKVFNHSFKNNGKWFIDNCPTTIQKDCPVCQLNSELWETNEDLVRQRSRKTSYYSNILVVKDPQNPENEGKVFLFRYGKKIHEKIMEKIAPPEDGIDDPIMVFDYYEGANFKLLIKQIKTGNTSYPSYDSSSFVSSSVIGDDETIAKIHDSLYELGSFISESNFKTVKELSDKLAKVLNQPISSSSTKTTKIVDNIASLVSSEEELSDEGSDDLFKGSEKDFFSTLETGSDE
jgi:hypothetical protein